MPLPFDGSSLVCLECVADPRLDRNKQHKLVDILVIALCGFLAGCEGWVDVELFGISKQKWLEKFLELPNGIPPQPPRDGPSPRKKLPTHRDSPDDQRDNAGSR